MKRKKDTADNKEQKQKQKRAKLRLSPMVVAMLPVVIGLAAMLLLIMQLHHSSTAQHNRDQVESLVANYGQQLKSLMYVLDSDSKVLAADIALKDAILLQDNTKIDQFVQGWSYRPNVLRVIVVPVGGEPPSGSLSYAALEHIAEAAANQPSSLEYVVAEGRQLFYKATPIMHSQEDRVIGTVLLVYDAEAMLKGLSEPALHTGWQVRLQQQRPEAPRIQLYQAGPGSSSGATSFKTPHPNWTLDVSIDNAGLLQSPWLIQYLAALLIVFVSGVVALLMLQGGQRKQRKLLATDAKALLEAIIIGRVQGLDSVLVNRELRTLVEPLDRLLQAANEPVASARIIDAQEPQAIAPPPIEAFGMVDDVMAVDILDMELDESAMQDFVFTDIAPVAVQVDDSIFRAYDIRGIVGRNLDEDTAYWIGRAVGSESIACGEARVVVGRDGRLSGPQLQEALVRGLTEAGCTVLDLGMVHTPVVYFATHQLEATSGVVVTGSHNPPDYNGFKIVIAGETLSNERITALYQRIVEQNLIKGSGSVQPVDLLPDYLKYITETVPMGRPFKVVVDCGNGVAGVVVPQLLESMGHTVIPLFCEVDGNFPNHHPDPSKPENLLDLINTVQIANADLGLAFDGDGDRLGVVTNTGQIIYSDHLMMLLAKDVVSRNPGADIVFDVKCSRRLPALISRCGGRPIMWKTGHSLMKAKMRETGALLAGEMSGHIFFRERWFGFDDGMYAAARVLEILSMERDTADRIFARFPTCPSTPELNIEVTEDSKFAIIEALQTTADWGEGDINTLDGIRVDYPTGWGLIRASNTSPMLVLRFEGDTEDELKHIQKLFRDQLLRVAPDIHWPF